MRLHSKLSVSFISLIVPALWASVIPMARAGVIYDGLTPDQQNQLQTGAQLESTEKVSGSSWPRVTVYQLVHATSEQAAAVSYDIADEPRYDKSVKSAEIIGGEGTRDVDATYITPSAVGDQNYTLEMKLSSTDGQYEFDWSKIGSGSGDIKSITGSAIFEPVGPDDKDTLIAYVDLVTPHSLFSGWATGQYVKGVKDTVQALAAQIEAEIQNSDCSDSSQLCLSAQLATLRSAMLQ